MGRLNRQAKAQGAKVPCAFLLGSREILSKPRRFLRKELMLLRARRGFSNQTMKVPLLPMKLASKYPDLHAVLAQKLKEPSSSRKGRDLSQLVENESFIRLG